MKRIAPYICLIAFAITYVTNNISRQPRRTDDALQIVACDTVELAQS